MEVEKEYVHWLLSVPRIGYVRCKNLLDHFGTAEAVWHASNKELCQVPSIKVLEAEAVQSSRKDYSFEQERGFLERERIQILHTDDPLYPSSLLQIHDPPHILYSKGNFSKQDEKSIAIVGSRQASNYGFLVAKKLSAELAAGGVTIISGLARGIDSIAHEACLAAGGRTIAVLAGGLLNVYPTQNRILSEKIARQGVVVSEFHPLTPAHPGMFPIRNRIISGLSRAVLVVEAAQKSGSLITADQALEQGRDVFAVPGPITSPLSQGTNELIRQGAKLISSGDDVWEEYPEWKTNSTRKTISSSVPISSEEKRLLSIIGYGGVHTDHLLKSGSGSVGEIHRMLLELELKGLVKQLPGHIYIRSDV